MYAPGKHGKVIAEGHRGYAAKYPENTLASFKAAMDLGVDQIEFDIWLSKDGVPVIMHDENAKRTTGVDRLITEMTIDEIKELDAGSHFDERFKGEKVPTLFEILTLFSQKPSLYFGVEIKGDNKKNADAAVKLLKEFDVLDNCCFYAWHASIIKYLKQKYGVRTMGYPDFIMIKLSDAPDYYEYCDEIGLPGDFLSSAMCNKYIKDGRPVRAFCMDSEEAVIDALMCDVHAITANDPVPLMTYLEKHDMCIDRKKSHITQTEKPLIIADCRNNDLSDEIASRADGILTDVSDASLCEKLEKALKAPDKRIVIDVMGNNKKAAAELMEKVNMLGCKNRVCVRTNNTVMLKYLKNTYDVHTIAYPAYFMEEIEDNRDFYGYRDETFVPEELMSRMLCKKLCAKGQKMIMEVSCSVTDIEAAIKHGAYALISKEPQKLIKYFEER